ncbi:MAG: M20 family metallo-hydrolase [Chitinophagaceae bacterium]|nr:M20 family metallo-hydrolase [Chitinophagaceae bacterium]
MSNIADDTIIQESIGLLQSLIRTPSFSRNEQVTATSIEQFLSSKGVPVQRHLNNVWALNQHYDPSLPTILLNSHHDTVKPNSGYTRDPFDGQVADGKLFGLGSNDAGASLVALLFTFLHFYHKQGLKYNLLFAATAEEEISGKGGIESLLPLMPPIAAGIVGEPTRLELAIAERGLMVLDIEINGRAGHAARSEGENAIYKALADIDWCRNYQFEKVSNLLGPVQMTVTVIETDNKAHNIVPAVCKLVLDVRINELYSPEEVLAVISSHVKGQVVPRSLRLRSTSISTDHPLVKAGIQMGKNCYGSPTTSDKALMPFPALKMGPGDSMRSHMADEFIFIHEIEEGINTYIQLLNQVL